MWAFYDKMDESRFQIRFNIFCARIFINPFRAFAPSWKARSSNLRGSHRPKSLKQWQFIRKTLNNSVETWWVFLICPFYTHSDSGRPVLGHTVHKIRAILVSIAVLLEIESLLSILIYYVRRDRVFTGYTFKDICVIFWWKLTINRGYQPKSHWFWHKIGLRRFSGWSLTSGHII